MRELRVCSGIFQELYELCYFLTLSNILLLINVRSNFKCRSRLNVFESFVRWYTWLK